MTDGPDDFGSGYFFESQKGISDRRAARGMSAHEDFAQGRSFDNNMASSGGSTVLVELLIKASCLLIVGGLWLGWQALKTFFWLIGAILSRR